MTETIRRTRGGNVNEGPERWKRARLNAEKRPASGGAKLYREREKFAAELKQRFFAHQNQGFTVLRGTDAHGRSARALHVCSVTCLGFQLQLEVGNYQGEERPTFGDYANLVARVLDEPGKVQTHTWVPRPEQTHYWERGLTVVTLDKAALARPATCRVCGTQMVGDKQTVKEIERVSKDTEAYVLVGGEFVKVCNLTVVDLTPHDAELLGEYSTPDLRLNYALRHGHRFDG